MPVYNEETFNYEILLRFGDTGPNKGQLTGASRTTITQTTKDGVPIATNINAPEQLALIAGEEGELLSTVLGEVGAATIVLNGQLQASLAELNAIAAQQLDRLVQAQVELKATKDELSVAQKAIDELIQKYESQDAPSGVPYSVGNEPLAKSS